MTQRLGTSERQGYAAEVAGLWSGLSGTLAQLEAIAEEPEAIDGEAAEALPVLQYSLHCAGELALGIDPPAGAEAVHAELAAALADARDATGEVLEELQSCGSDGLVRVLHEWRGALFRVRLARMRLNSGATRPPAPGIPELPRPRAALAATVLVACGTVAFAGGAVAGLWGIWALGIVLLAAGFLVYRP